MKFHSTILSVLGGLMLVTSCHRSAPSEVVSDGEDLEAKKQLQGIWVDDDTDDVLFCFKGDTLFYADSTSAPVTFKVVGDTLILGSDSRYRIVQHTAHALKFSIGTGDEIHARKSDNPSDSLYFVNLRPRVLTLSSVVKTDSVVTFDGERYHTYVYVNPTRYKVEAVSYNPDGMKVTNVYYDNVVHLCVYRKAECLFSRDFVKRDYLSLLPADFIKRSILTDIRFTKVDSQGFHFYSTLACPDGGAYYLVDVIVDFDGKHTYKLVK